MFVLAWNTSTSDSQVNDCDVTLAKVGFVKRLKMNAVIATEQTVSPNNRTSIHGRTRNWV